MKKKERKSLAYARGSACGGTIRNREPSRARKQAILSGKIPTWPHCLLFFTVALALRIDTVIQSPKRVLRGMESQSIAESLARTGQFANPFRTPTGPTAHLAPAHPLLLAGLMTLFPNDSSYETAKQVLSSLAASLLYAILPLAALALGLARRAGLIAGWLGIAVFLFLPRNV